MERTFRNLDACSLYNSIQNGMMQVGKDRSCVDTTDLQDGQRSELDVFAGSSSQTSSGEERVHRLETVSF